MSRRRLDPELVRLPRRERSAEEITLRPGVRTDRDHATASLQRLDQRIRVAFFSQLLQAVGLNRPASCEQRVRIPRMHDPQDGREHERRGAPGRKRERLTPGDVVHAYRELGRSGLGGRGGEHSTAERGGDGNGPNQRHGRMLLRTAG